MIPPGWPRIYVDSWCVDCNTLICSEAVIPSNVTKFPQVAQHWKGQIVQHMIQVHGLALPEAMAETRETGGSVPGSDDQGSTGGKAPAAAEAPDLNKSGGSDVDK